ncbi:MAG: hypothetical protein IPO87_16920 [Flavobacteriales bacterium]|nr:hypothetical protein [Flavobacteriales bacterium]
MQNATLGTGVTYQWQSADDAGFTVNLTALGTNATQITSQTAPKYYRCVVTCPAGAPTDGTSTEVLVNVNTDLCFCAPYPVSQANNTGDEELINVTVGGMNNTSNCITCRWCRFAPAAIRQLRGCCHWSDSGPRRCRFIQPYPIHMWSGLRSRNATLC